jgi:hypothetical protein
MVYVRDLDRLWFQTSEVFRPAAGGWTAIRVDASPSSIAWETRGHLAPWCGSVAQGIEEVGVKLFSAEPGEGVAFLDDVLVTARPVQPLGPLQALNFATSGDVVPAHGLFEITFELNRDYDNPFDPDEIDIKGVFIAPSGMVQAVPGFFYQDYVRQSEEKTETLTPVGRPVWKVRYSPKEPGRHRYFIEIKERAAAKPRRFFQIDGDPRLQRSLLCEPSDEPGYVRVSARDPRYFEFDNGTFFYPIGHNIPATYNVKNAEDLGLTIHKHEGTFAYDRFLDGMERGEENFARIWLASWSFGLEWSRKYSWEYRGLGRYNLRNAWRLDYVLNECARRGVYAQVALTTFGHYRSHEFEGDWAFSPYNAANGGPIDNETKFWTSDVCQKHYQRMVRYVMARWGYSTHVMAWEVSNEIDLVTAYTQCRETIADWHRQCVRTIRRYDQGQHLVTTNFAVWSRDPLILSMPEISYSSTNRYERGIVAALKQVYDLKGKLLKPAIMAECGDDFKGSTAQITESYIPICLWAAYMMPFAAAGTQWWWDFIDDRDLYHYFRGLSRYARGEDRRGQGLEMQSATAVALPDGKPEDKLAVECIGNGQKAYFWLYETMLLRPDLDWSPLPRKDIGIRFGHLKDGRYNVEFWHPIRGEVLDTQVAEVKKGLATVAAPEFTRYVAGKVKPAPEEPAKTESAAAGSP